MTPRLEALKPDAQVRGLVWREAVRIVSAERLGEAACKVAHRGRSGAGLRWPSVELAGDGNEHRLPRVHQLKKV